MFKEYPDDISFNDATEFTMTVEGDFSKLYEILGIEVPKKEDNLEELKNACETVTDGIKAINQILAERISKSLLDIRVKKEDIRNKDILVQIKDQETAELEKACEIVERHNLCYNSPRDVCFAKSCKECNHYQDPNVVYKAVVRLLDYTKKSLSSGEEEKSKEKVLDDADLKAACDVVKRYRACLAEDCGTRSCDECKYFTAQDTVDKAVDILLEHADKSLNGGEEISNRYIRDVTGGVELYDYAGNYVGYVHGFKGVKSETDIRSIVQNSWGLLTLNPFTLEKVIEDHGYISDVHFLVELYKDPSDIKLPDDWHVIKRKAKEDSK